MWRPWATCVIPLCALSVSACSLRIASVSDSRPAASAPVLRATPPAGTLAKMEKCPTQENRQPHESPFVGIGAENCCDARGISGAYVVKLYEKSPGKSTKLRIGDRIVQFGGCRIENTGQLSAAIANATVQVGVTVYFVRNGSTDSVALFTRSASPESSLRGGAPRPPAEKERLCRAAGLRPAC